MRRVPLLLTLALLPFVAAADAPPRAKMELALKDYEIPMRDYSFPSGLRIIFQSDKSQPIVSITSVVDRGSTSDPPGLEGIAHVCEHMWFRSQQQGADGKLLPKVWDLLREMGANLNASTADDWTNYMTVAPKDKLIPLLRLESLRLKSAWANIPNEVLLTEREVVRNELRMRYENGFQAAFGYISVKLFPSNHPYGRAAYAGIGSHDSLNAITLPDIKKFFQDNYKPEHTTIVVVGDFELEDTPKFLDEFALDQLVDPKNPTAELKLVPPPVRVSGPAAEPPPPVQPLEVKGETTGLTIEHGPVEKPTLVLGWSLPAGYRPEENMMQMAANQLQSAIYQELRPSWDFTNTDSEITAVGCGVQPQKEASFAYCVVEVRDEKDAKNVAGKALDGLYRVWTTDEMWRRYQQWAFSFSKMASMAYTLSQVDLVSSLGGRATGTAAFVHYTGDPLYYSRQIEWYNQVDPDKTRAIAEKYLNRNRAVGVLIMPYEEGDISTDTSDAQYRGARREDVLDTVLSEEQLNPEFIAQAVIPPDTSKLRESTLGNGMKLVTMQHSNAPLAQIAVVFDGGYDSMPTGETYFASEMWIQESTVDALRIVGFPGFSMNQWTTDYEIEASAGNLTDAMFVLRDRVDNIKPYTSGRLDWVDARKDDILGWMDEPEGWAEYETMARLLPGHPDGDWYDHADFDRFNKWGADVAGKVFADFLRPENGRVYVIGNIDHEEARQAAELYFGSWKGWGKKPDGWTKPSTTPAPYPEPPARTVLLLDKPTSSQTNVSYSCQLGKVDEATGVAAQVLGDALSESTWLALREQTGASYGAYAAGSYDRAGNASLSMGGLVQNDASALAVKTFLELGQWAKDGKIPNKTLAVVKYDRAQKYVQGHQSTGQMMSRIRGTFFSFGGVEYFKKYPKYVSQVTMDTIKPLLDRCVGHEVVTAIGPVAVIKPMFDKAGIPVEVFDWEKARLDYAAKHNLKSVLKADEKKKKEEAAKKK